MLWNTDADGGGSVSIPESNNLQTHVQVDDLSVGDGGTVTSWSDASGNGNDLSGGDPIFNANEINGFGTVRFDGDSDVLDVGFNALSQPYSVAHVVRVYDNQGSYEYISGSEQGSGTFSISRYANSASENPVGFNYFAGSDLFSASGNYSQFHILVNRVDGANSVIDLDGTEVAVGDTGGNVLDGYSLGARQDGLFGNVDISESLVWSVGLDNTTRQDAFEYLNNKYSVV